MEAAQLLNKAEGCLMSCERGDRSSREAAGIHYHLRQARYDPKREPPTDFWFSGPWRVAGSARSAGSASSSGAGAAGDSPAAAAAAVGTAVGAAPRVLVGAATPAGMAGDAGMAGSPFSPTPTRGRGDGDGRPRAGAGRASARVGWTAPSTGSTEAARWRMARTTVRA